SVDLRGSVKVLSARFGSEHDLARLVDGDRRAGRAIERLQARSEERVVLLRLAFDFVERDAVRRTNERAGVVQVRVARRLEGVPHRPTVQTRVDFAQTIRRV